MIGEDDSWREMGLLGRFFRQACSHPVSGGLFGLRGGCQTVAGEKRERDGEEVSAD